MLSRGPAFCWEPTIVGGLNYFFVRQPLGADEGSCVIEFVQVELMTASSNVTNEQRNFLNNYYTASPFEFVSCQGATCEKNFSRTS
ncbi:Hypothetical predicted protein [Cloeon dipterum]|uniref:Uncharacterized protein n=1 Tax=Cloeon dipterum TaxID=197152 RepID=A0A8S1DEI5_9INSE|nr:Hypothetical predicted protein [Cloeon dipterum]